MSEVLTVYMKLLDRCFLLVGEPEADEIWEFTSGSTVICEYRELGGGLREVAVRLAS